MLWNANDRAANIDSTTGTGTGTTTGPSSTGTGTSTSASSSTSAAAPPPEGDFFEGEGTFFTPGLGSCGIESTEQDFIAALAKDLFDPDTPNGNANNNPNCNRKIYVQMAGAEERRKKRDENSEYFTMVIIRRQAQPIKVRKVHRRNILGRDDPEDGSPTATITPAPQHTPHQLQKRAGVTVTVVDRCPVCAKYDLDLSPAAYDAIGADQDDGRVEIEWKWVD